jgi:hypothetical protein
LKVIDGSDIDLVREARNIVVILTVHKDGIYKFINAFFLFLFSHGIPTTCFRGILVSARVIRYPFAASYDQ